MAKLGFYDIRTFECLSKSQEVDTYEYNSIFESKKDDEENKEDEQSKQQ